MPQSTQTQLSTSQSVKTFTRMFVAVASVVAGLSVISALVIRIVDDPPTGGGGATTAPRGTTIAITTLAMASNGNHSLASINGELWAWGMNNVGQIGDGTVTFTFQPNGLQYPQYTYNNDRYYPVRVLAASGLVFNGVAVGDHSLALQNNGAVWAWGPNEYKELGIASTSPCGTGTICSIPQLVDGWEG